MVKLSLLDKKNIGKTVSFIVDLVSFSNISNEVIIFVNFNQLPQELITYIQEHNIKIRTWYGIGKLRLFIPIDLIDKIESWHGNSPKY